jgi:archaemetzincin
MENALKLYSDAFFSGCDVKILKPGCKFGKIKLPNDFLKEMKISSRDNCGQLQYHAGEIIQSLKQFKQKETFCILAVTNLDLYPRDSWNFVFGLASLENACGVFSFCRYNPEFLGQ